MLKSDYFMENKDESIRLDIKTDTSVIKQIGSWAGIRPGMRVADLGCGSGKTAFALSQLVQPDGEVIGIDFSQDRIDFAKSHYNYSNVDFICADIRKPMTEFGYFDCIWIRFVLEYYRSSSFSIVKNIANILKSDGIMCLLDLDHNCLSHFGLPKKLEQTIEKAMHLLETNLDFDPYVGRKLYSYLYDLNYHDIDVYLIPHHLIFGELKDKDEFNWSKKVELAAKRSGYSFDEYDGGYNEFVEEFKNAFNDPRRFSYTPLICCKGKKPNI